MNPIMTLQEINEAEYRSCAPVALIIGHERQASRLELLAELDGLSQNERWHRLQLLTDDEAVALYIVCVNCYGDESSVCADLMRRMAMWIEKHTKTVICNDCLGSGTRTETWNKSNEKCQTCHGTGRAIAPHK